MPKITHKFIRRCRNHDYRSRFIYLITILKSDLVPNFSSITQDPRSVKISPLVTLHPVGKIIYEGIMNLSRTYPELKILRQIIMPDHIHFELFVKNRTEKTLGSIIAEFKSFCTKEYYRQFPDSPIAKTRKPIFKPGFNDKIAFKPGSKDAFYNYILDNPRSYLVKKLCADYFYHKLWIEIGGVKCGLYGNIFLLDNPLKSFVKISRKKEMTENLDKKLKEWEEIIRCNGVLVSPFINPEEKLIRDFAIENESGLIIVLNYRFSDRTKPYKSLFNLCAEGRLLIVSTEEFATPPKVMKYSEARKLNGIASAIADAPPRAFPFHKK